MVLDCFLNITINISAMEAAASNTAKYDENAKDKQYNLETL